MWILTGSVVVLLAAWAARSNRTRPLDRKDINRMRLFDDKTRREDAFPLE